MQTAGPSAAAAAALGGRRASVSKPRGAERVKVYCRLRPLLQREKEGWSYDEYTQQFGDDASGNSSDTHAPGTGSADDNDGQQRTESSSDGGGGGPHVTFVTDKARLNFAGCTSSVVSLAGDGRTIVFEPPSSSSSSSSEKKEFVFDASLAESADQELVYAQVAREIVRDVLEGYNGTIFAYGQTATGKTHTMVGREGHDLLHSAERGIIPRALEEIFHCTEQSRAQTRTTIALSYVQIYCERVFDLLDPETPHASILIREDPERGVYLDGASCVSVASASECLGLLNRGNANRTVASTGMNAHSSRSHAVLILRIERKDVLAAAASSSDPPRQTIKMSNLYLVDLAGSERVKKAKVLGRHVNELKAINLSLSALGNCISALSKRQTHVPYRDSKLTRLLQSSLGGNAKTALVITISPSPTEAHETLSTMLFGQRAMQVAVNAHCNVLSVLDYKALYEDTQQRLDACDERARALESAALVHERKVVSCEDQLLKAQMRIQHLEFENQAGKAALEASARGATYPAPPGTSSSSSDPVSAAPDIAPAVCQQLAELVFKHGEDVHRIKDKCDLQVATYKKLAEQASQEWHDVEDALANERQQVLQSLQELKDFKLRYFELEEATTDRIAELVQDVRERERELRHATESSSKQLTAQRNEITALQKQLADAEREQQRLKETLERDFVPRETIAQMEALYEKAIAKLQDRVGSLESRSSAVPAAAAGGSQRKIVVTPPPVSNQAPERANIGGPQPRKSAPRAVPQIGRLVPGAKTASLPNSLR